MFPVSIVSKTTVWPGMADDIFIKIFIDKVDAKIRNSGIRRIEKGFNSVAFRGTIFRFVWNGLNLLNGIQSARVQCNMSERGMEISTRFYFTEVFFICLMFSIIPVSMFSIDWKLAAEILAIIWVGVYVGNMVVSILRFNMFLLKTRRQIEKENEHTVLG